MGAHGRYIAMEFNPPGLEGDHGSRESFKPEPDSGTGSSCVTQANHVNSLFLRSHTKEIWVMLLTWEIKEKIYTELWLWPRCLCSGGFLCITECLRGL